MQMTHQTPIQRVMALVTRIQSLKPMRVWTRVGARDGMVLAAGISYQALFALFAAFYVVFAVVGLWLGTNRDAMNSLIDGFNGFLPGIISDTAGGLLTRDQVIEIAAGATGILSITGFVAFIAVVMTSIGWVSFSRIGVRRMLGLGTQQGNPVLLQVRDLVAAVVFALMLGIGSAVGSLSTIIVRGVLDTVQLGAGWLVDGAVTIVSFAVAMGVDVLMLRLYFRFLVDAKIPSRLVWPGAVIGGAGMAVLQSLAGLLIGGTPSNPLLAAFAFLIGLLLWFRLISVVLLVAAAWIRVSADDHGIDLAPPTAEQQRQAVADARIITARLRLEEAERERRHAPWYRRRGAAAEVRAAQDDLRRLQHDRRASQTAA